MEQKASAGQFGLRTGLILGLVLSLVTVVSGLFGYVGEQSMNFIISLVLWIGFVYWGMTEFKKANRGFMSFGQGVGLGTLAIVIGTAISLVFTYIYMFYLDPAYFDLIMAKSQEQMIKQGMDDQTIELALDQTVKYFWVGFVFVFLGSAIAGLIVSLIMSAILKTNPIPADYNENKLIDEIGNP